jgi:hypothetical protein
LTGIGGKVGYQRQHEVYQQFIHQELYASGYGKGAAKFGWTFAPLPGTDRIAPGVRTTYAILVIPEDALLLELKGASSTHKRETGPSGAIPLSEKRFKVIVPDEQTEGFWVDSINYTPVVSGERVTVMLTGKYFSPQIGVLVNGEPLSRVISIGKNEGAFSTVVTQTVAQGEYEYLSSDKIVMTFRMDADYFGTPVITLVTPEKTSDINYFRDLTINFRPRQKSLVESSKTEPMFLRPLDLTSLDFLPPDGSGQRRLRLNGRGLRSEARVSINGVEIPQANLAHSSTNVYEMTLPLTLFRSISDAAGRDNQSNESTATWKVTYRHHNRQAYEEAELPSVPVGVVSAYTVTRYSRDVRTQSARLEFEIAIPDQSRNPVISIDRNDGTAAIQHLRDHDYLVTLDINRDRDNFPVTITDDPGRPYRYVIEMPDLPTVDRVVNLATDQEEGPANVEHEVRILGKNLLHVREVWFNSSEADIVDVAEDVILVRTPKLEGPARVHLKTDLTVAGVRITNIRDLGRANKSRYNFKK